ncbi:hypothetical protein ACIODS_14045 [Micromonospora chalcea]|jgi:hypothetical protein|uniref:DUF5709 domain-containing protein n=2 Tax=Micromonospora TaxID=1873 RepID=A0ABQ6UQ18_9ACTN|nr:MULTISPECIES: hypothetical protein [Micromonospora]AYF32121.1 hypothetical protein CSH63_32720 [Micromonospora tulbaghiae]KAB1119011.1 hypothetical protein F6X54_01005 [Micromonospora aurantiaca]MCO1616367.1 hypothetical protein [Micromonospora sp. CPM1]MCT2280110.1 hypothetical protein [Micromonospora chalcea]NED50554.1 hypothetical protein [Micromonospora aurantiaca]
MTDRNPDHEHLAALGQPPEGVDTLPEPDFANEHDRTAVDRDVVTGEDEDEREPEASRGWAGEDHGTTPT